MPPLAMQAVPSEGPAIPAGRAQSRIAPSHFESCFYSGSSNLQLEFFFSAQNHYSALLNNHYNGNFTGGRARTQATGTPPPAPTAPGTPKGAGGHPRGAMALFTRPK